MKGQACLDDVLDFGVPEDDVVTEGRDELALYSFLSGRGRQSDHVWKALKGTEMSSLRGARRMARAALQD